MNPKFPQAGSGLFALDPEATWKHLQRLYDKQEALIGPVGMFAPIANAHAAWLAHGQKLANWMAGGTKKCLALQTHAALRFAGGIAEDSRAMKATLVANRPTGVCQ